MTIIESVRDFIAECSYLEKLLRIHADFLPARETAYSIEEMPVQTIVAQNVDGSTRRGPIRIKQGTTLPTRDCKAFAEQCERCFL